VVVVVVVMVVLGVPGWVGCPTKMGAGVRRSRNGALKIGAMWLTIVVVKRATGLLKHVKKRTACPGAIKDRTSLGEGERARDWWWRGKRTKGRRTLQAARPKEGAWLDANAGSRCRWDPVGSCAPAPAAAVKRASTSRRQLNWTGAGWSATVTALAALNATATMRWRRRARSLLVALMLSRNPRLRRALDKRAQGDASRRVQMIN
jgi:hypothetical protein